MKAKYYRHYNEYQGERFFKVVKGKDVLQIVASTAIKRGRPYMAGINMMKYISFIGSWGWKMQESRCLTEISKKEFEKKFLKIINKLKK